MHYHIVFIIIISVFINACDGTGADSTLNNPPEDPPLINPLNILSATVSAKYDDPSINSQVITPNGKHMYAFVKLGKSYLNRIVYFTRDEASNIFQYTEEILEDVNFEYVSAMVASPEGSHLYVSHDLGITIFNINSTTGKLTYVDMFSELEIPGGQSFSQMTLTPDGNFLYVQGNNGEVVIFSRDSQTGEITYLYQQPTNLGITKFVISPDSKYLHLFYEAGLTINEIDTTTGSFTQIQDFGHELFPTGEFAKLGVTSDISISTNGSELYLYGFIGIRDASQQVLYREGLLILNREIHTGLISFKQFIPINDLAYPAPQYELPVMTVLGEQVYIQKWDRFEGKAHNVVLNIFSKTLNNDFEFTGKTLIGEFLGSSGALVTDHLISSQNHLISTYAGKSIQLFVDPKNASIQQSVELSINENEIPGLGSTNHAITSPDNKNIYTLAAIDEAITALNYDKTTGEIKHLQTIYANSKSFFSDIRWFHYGANKRTDVINGSITITPDGKFIYIIGSNDIVALSRDINTGLLARTSTSTAGIFAFNDIGDGSSGLPTDTPIFYNADELEHGRFNLESITISPDGLYIYAAGYMGNSNAAVAVLSRNEINGDLTLVELIDTGSSNVRDNWKPRIIVTSPDGRNVYFADQHGGVLFNFSRDQSTGRLTIHEVHQGIELIDVSNITFGINERYLYVSADDIAQSPYSFGGLFPNTISMLVFERDRSTGELTLMQTLEKNGKDADGNELNSEIIQGGIRHSAISPYGTELYVVTQKERTIYETKRENGLRLDVYLINPEDGTLSLVQKEDDGYVGLGISSVTTSIDGDHVFVTNERYSSLSIHERDNAL